MRAFHNDPAVKQKYIDRVKAHALADEITQGIYWDSGKGCAVGCTLHMGADAHLAYPKFLGIPAVIAYAEDQIFEKSIPLTAKTFPLEFLQAIPVGADLSLVDIQLAIWMIDDETCGILNGMRVQLMPYASIVLELLKRRLAGETVWTPAWSDVLVSLRRMPAEPRTFILESICEAQMGSDSQIKNAVSDFAHIDGGIMRIRAKLLELLAAAPVPENE